MPRIEVSDTQTDKMITVWIEKKLTLDAIAESVEMAKKEIAKKIWDENADKIMAQMDLKGLAALVAVYASKKLAEK